MTRTDWTRCIALAAAAVALAGCHNDMWTQPKRLAQQDSDFFADGQADRMPVPGTIARNELKEDEAYFTGRRNGKLVTELPSKVVLSKELLARGKERFEVFCTHCHGYAGDGKGMIAQRGLSLRRPPASYHTDRLREMPIGHFYEVMSRGFGVMFSQATRVPVEDRWAIAAYIRALQLSHDFDASSLGPDEAQKLGVPAEEQLGLSGAHGNKPHTEGAPSKE